VIAALLLKIKAIYCIGGAPGPDPRAEGRKNASKILDIVEKMQSDEVEAKPLIEEESMAFETL